MTDRQKELLAENLRLQKEVERISLRNHLTIPQSIADELDEIYENHIDTHEDISLVFHYMKLYPAGTYSNAMRWNNTANDSIRSHSNTNIAFTYLAGKALGVDLVKVVAE